MSPATQGLEPLAEETTVLLKALAHPARLMICCQLLETEMSVSQIEETLGIRQPRLSRELAKLREEELVQTRRESKVIFYRLKDERASAIIRAVCAIMQGRPWRPSPAIEPSPSFRPDPPVPRPNQVGGYGVFARTKF